MAFIDFVTSFEKVKVQLVDSFPDLCVYITKSKSEAKGKEEIWFFEDGGGSDKLKVKIVSNFADIKVKYVASKSQAGWKNKAHKLQGRIG
jgi:hypothetical protein